MSTTTRICSSLRSHSYDLLHKEVKTPSFFSPFTTHYSLAAFTLAEVLITLGIIGIVAAMTIPTLMNKTQNQEFVTGLKKAYSETNQALKLMANDYGCTGDLKCTGLFDGGTTQDSFGEVFVKYFKITKDCGTSTNQDCWAAKTNAYYDGSATTDDAFNGWGGYKFVTSDGMSFAVYDYSNSCLTDGTGGSTNWSNGRTGNMSQTCGYLVIDVNGLKKPNVYGRDTFEFFITNGKGAMLYPRGGADDKYNGTDKWWSDNAGEIRYCYSGDKWGSNCTGRIMEQGWQMNY